MRSGIFSVCKPPGMTSHDVVDVMRRLLPRRTKVGHAGTLDPGAAGVLVLCVGVATRLIEYVVATDKQYRAEACLGLTTDTLDAEGTVLMEADASTVTAGDVQSALAGLVGPQMMEPPMYSAARVGGERLYDLARQGREVAREARPVTVHSAGLVGFKPGRRALALADFACSKGAYVRVLCAQLGERLGVGAHMAFLVRTAVGPHALAEASTLEELRAAADQDRLPDLSVPVETALAHLPELRLGAPAAAAFRRGNAAPGAPAAEGLVRVHDAAGALLGIGEAAVETGERVVLPRKVLPE
ncbi:MAG: tRNA pseudouridine(55) synthase TruB [Armatimonadetes bacterium]|nr:tRNA pseudouridine(55) synthase TruB [Armatimonadota bacterium]